jgi:hypothetical protein
MVSGNYSRFRHALRLVATVFLLSSPCQGAWRQAESPLARTVSAAPTGIPPLAGDPRLFAGASRPVR